MINSVKNVLRIQAAMSCNRFLFWLKKLPLIRRLFPDSLYGAVNAKQRLMAAVEVLKVLSYFAGKFLYLFLCCYAPLVLLADEMTPAGNWPMFVSMLFFMSFFVGCFLQSGILTASLVKYTCVRQMGMSARACLAATTGRDHLQMLITFTPALMVFSWGLGRGPWAGLLLSLELAAARAIGELLHVLLYLKTEKLPGKNAWFIIVLVMGGLAGAYIPVFAGAALPLDRFLLNPAVCIALVGCGAWAAMWLLRYPHYRELVWKTCKAENVSTAAAKQNAAQAAFKDVQMKDSDLTAEDAGSRIRSLKGYEYLNALFFRRHRRLLVKPVKYELMGVGAVFLAGLAGALLSPELTRSLVEQLPAFLPTFVFIMYFMCNTLGQRICKAMFYNCDISFLRYGWYRERKVVLHNFAIRLRRVAGLNLLVAGAICLALAAPVLLTGAALPPLELAAFLLSILCLSVFFTVHPLFMYYVFQPYTSQLAVKNPFFSVINWVVYMVCVLCLQIKQPPHYFVLIVLAATVVYSAAALLVVWRRAPKTFRVK